MAVDMKVTNFAPETEAILIETVPGGWKINIWRDKFGDVNVALTDEYDVDNAGTTHLLLGETTGP
jgi:hypothetical protein